MMALFGSDGGPYKVRERLSWVVCDCRLCQGTAGRDPGLRETVVNGGVANGGNDPTEEFNGVKRGSSSEREQFRLKRLRRCEIVWEMKGKERKGRTRNKRRKIFNA